MPYERYGDGPHGGTHQAVENPPGNFPVEQWRKHPSTKTQAEKPQCRGENRARPEKESVFAMKAAVHALLIFSRIFAMMANCETSADVSPVVGMQIAASL